ncbi:MAG: hypothetical protein OXI33_08000 [Chloroflexota bacterium]|nr:hypothetical protein [Chloroflexota bacterium]
MAHQEVSWSEEQPYPRRVCVVGVLYYLGETLKPIAREQVTGVAGSF